MAKKKKETVEYRYYEMPTGSPILPLLGKKWEQNYGKGIDFLHFHNHLEIGICYDGIGTLTLDDVNHTFTGQMITVIPKNFPHTTNSKDNTISVWEYLFIDSEGFLKAIYKENPYMAERLIRRINKRPHICSWYENPETTALIRRLVEIMRMRKELYMEEARGIIWALLVQIARWNQKDENPVEKKGDILTERKPGNSSIIAPALDYISEKAQDPIRIEFLAALCHISENYFRKVFRECMRMTPVEYINWIRIKKACDELVRTNDSISSIAERSGFTQMSTFNRNFRQIVGASPREWRKNPENYQQKLLKYDIKTHEGW